MDRTIGVKGFWRCTPPSIAKPLVRVVSSLALLFPIHCIATEMVYKDNDFLITRDFTPTVIGATDLATARVFVEPMRDLSPSEAAELTQFAIDSLSKKVRVVQTRDDANYRILIRMEKIRDYAIRNPKREPTHGLIVLSTCKWPIKEATRDCENITYYYFADFAYGDIFRRVFRMWLGYVLPASSR
jgi:hypothetical protein